FAGLISLLQGARSPARIAIASISRGRATSICSLDDDVCRLAEATAQSSCGTGRHFSMLDISTPLARRLRTTRGALQRQQRTIVGECSILAVAPATTSGRSLPY